MVFLAIYCLKLITVNLYKTKQQSNKLLQNFSTIFLTTILSSKVIYDFGILNIESILVIQAIIDWKVTGSLVVSAFLTMSLECLIPRST